MPSFVHLEQASQIVPTPATQTTQASETTTAPSTSTSARMGSCASGTSRENMSTGRLVSHVRQVCQTICCQIIKVIPTAFYYVIHTYIYNMFYVCPGSLEPLRSRPSLRSLSCPLPHSRSSPPVEPPPPSAPIASLVFWPATGGGLLRSAYARRGGDQRES